MFLLINMMNEQFVCGVYLLPCTCTVFRAIHLLGEPQGVCYSCICQYQEGASIAFATGDASQNLIILSQRAFN